MRLALRDSLSGATRVLRPDSRRPTTLYVCGPTVYDSAHVGHGRTYLYFDLARRILSEGGGQVHHVMNITDVEDKINQRASGLGITWRTLARREERSFLSDLDRLGILLPREIPRASDFVRPMIRWLERLHKTGRVHRMGDEWLYTPATSNDKRNFPVGRELSRHLVREPGVVNPSGSTDLRDFLVWKRQDPPLPSWPSPWGPGVPGWHLECFTMADSYLGLPVDLHGGGFDLIYPHHFSENDLALTLNRSLFSRRFLHTGFVTQDGQKMSKSIGNLVRLRAAIEEGGPSAVRWYLLSRPSNQRLSWDPSEFRRATAEFEAVSSACRSTLTPGASGSLPLSGLQTAGRRVAQHLGAGLRADRSFEELRSWSSTVSRSESGRFPRGTLREARAEYRTIERLTGLSLI